MFPFVILKVSVLVAETLERIYRAKRLFDWLRLGEQVGWDPDSGGQGALRSGNPEKWIRDGDKSPSRIYFEAL
jgi:hypothetical protein